MDIKKINQIEAKRIKAVFEMVSGQEHDCHLSGEDGCDCCVGEHKTPEDIAEEAEFHRDALREHVDQEIKELNNK